MSNPVQFSHVIGQSQVIEEIQNIINEYKAQSYRVEVLEAGCGSCSCFKFTDEDIISGIDISEAQLSKNALLDVRLLGDIQTYTTNTKYDIVVCWNVLEHIEEPKKALSNLLTWTKKGGLLIISVPNIYSVKGIVTKITPFSFHKWFYKYIYKINYQPFPTYLRLSASPKSLLRFSSEQKIEYKALLRYSLRKPFGYIYKVVVNIIRAMTLGKLDADLSQFYLVIRKSKECSLFEES